MAGLAPEKKTHPCILLVSLRERTYMYSKFFPFSADVRLNRTAEPDTAR